MAPDLMSAAALSAAAFISAVTSDLLLSSSAQATPSSVRPSTETPALKVFLGLIEGVVGRVHALDHGGQDLAGMHAVLVRVDADAELAGVSRRAQHADARAAGRVVDHVGAAVDLALGEFAALHRIVPGRARGAGHVLEHLGVLLGVFHALDVAAGELADERDVHAAHEADLAGLGSLGRQQTDQERALMLLEHDRLHVRLLDDGVDDRELGFRELLGHLLQRGLLAEAHRHDRREAVTGEAAQRLLALRVVLRFEIAVFGVRCP